MKYLSIYRSELKTHIIKNHEVHYMPYMLIRSAILKIKLYENKIKRFFFSFLDCFKHFFLAFILLCNCSLLKA